MRSIKLNKRNGIFLVLVLLILCGLLLYKQSYSVNYNLLPQYRPVWAADERLNIVFLFAVKSPPENYALRKAVRETWGTYISSSSNSKVMFYMGKSLKAEDNLKVAHESEFHKDIIQGDFIDSFTNQSLSTVNALKYITKTFNKVKYFFKVDDSTFVNVPRLVRVLKTNKRMLTRFIMGEVMKDTKPERNERSIWYVSKDRYSPDYFPTYVQSFAYLLSGHLIPELLQESLKLPFLWIEDAYVTGVLAQNLNVTYIENTKFGSTRDKCEIINYVAISKLHTVEAMKKVYITIEIPNENCNYEI